jgi:RimJ/RimL family protein N-acetyltransferase
MELGWLLTEQAEGHGYAFEAARAFLPLARKIAGPGKLVSYIHTDNSASIRLAEKLGAVCDRDPHPLFPDGLVYRHSKEPTT